MEGTLPLQYPNTVIITIKIIINGYEYKLQLDIVGKVIIRTKNIYIIII